MQVVMARKAIMSSNKNDFDCKIMGNMEDRGWAR